MYFKLFQLFNTLTNKQTTDKYQNSLLRQKCFYLVVLATKQNHYKTKQNKKLSENVPYLMWFSVGTVTMAFL